MLFKSTPRKHTQGILAALALLLVAVACDLDSPTALPPEVTQEQPPVAQAEELAFSPDAFYRHPNPRTPSTFLRQLPGAYFEPLFTPTTFLRFESREALAQYRSANTDRLDVVPDPQPGEWRQKMVIRLSPKGDLEGLLVNRSYPITTEEQREYFRGHPYVPYR